MGLLSFLLTALGVLLLLASLAGVALGLYMASSRGTRGAGMFFALWWTPAAAAAAGIVMHDPVTFLVGALCFVVAGAALAIERNTGRNGGGRKKKGENREWEPGSVSRLSERTTQRRVRTNRARRREAAS